MRRQSLRRQFRPQLEVLEARWVPSGTAPTAVNDAYSILHGRPLAATPLSNDSDPEGDALTASIVGFPSHGMATFNPMNGALSYTPFGNYVGSDSLTYRLYDGSNYGNVATIALTVTNQLPVAVDDGPFDVAHGHSLINLNLRGNDTDADGDTLTVSIVQYAAHGTVYQDYMTGNYSYSAYNNYTGPDSFTCKLFDGAEYSNIATASINVTNSAPVAVNDGVYTVQSGGTITGLNLRGNDSDADGDSLSLTIVQYPAHGYVYQDYMAGTFTFSAYGNYKGPDSFTYKVNDGTQDSNVATVSIDITNRPPTINSVTLSNTAPKTNDMLTATVSGYDPENDSLT